MKKRIKIRYPLNFQPYISKVANATAEENYKDLYGKKQPPMVTVVWFSMQNRNWNVVKYFLKYYRALNA